MNKLARILLVEPDVDPKSDLDRQLERAGHEVAAVPNVEAARGLVLEGLLPDVVVAHAVAPEEEQSLHEILPGAAHLRIVGAPGHPGDCSADPAEILRRVEEVLVHQAPHRGYDDATRCMDLARRLANSLPKTRTAPERIDLITDGFDAFFGVTGTLVVRRGPSDEWIEVRQGVPVEVAERISREISRRTKHRGLRPFLADVEVDGELHQVACLAVQTGDVETDVALALRSAPVESVHRETLMNLVGSAIRSAMNEEVAEDTRELLEAQVSSFESLLAMSREFMEVGSRRELCVAILRSLQCELGMTRSALFLSRNGEHGMLDLQAARGFAAGLLDRIGLSTFHGIGAESLRSPGPRRLALFPQDGAASRELRLLGAASLRWVVPVRIGSNARGALFFGCPDAGDDLLAADRQILHALLEAASVALQGLERVEALRDLSVCTLHGLVSAIELQHPERRGHAERVAQLAVKLGRAVGLAAGELRELTFAALLHDVGKLVETARPGTAPEAGAVERRRRTHPVIGSRILSRARPAAAVIQAVEQHHERWDGLGFPYGLQEDGIQLLARIVGLANAYDHLRFGRDAAATAEEALRRLELGAGLLWDPGLVAVFAAEIGRGPGAEATSGADATPPDDGWLLEILAAT